MKSTDKFLIGIVAGIVVLVFVAFIVTLTRPEPAYQPEDSPQGVAHNYLLALQKKDYQRAYTYLSSQLEGYPVSVEKFIENVKDFSWNFRSNVDTTLAVESAQIKNSRSVVKVRESRFYGGDLFDSGQSFTVFEMDLHLEGGEWKIVDSDCYFVWCWKDHKGCR